MFERILIAYDGSPESGRALLTGNHLAKSLNAELRTVSAQEKLPLYVGCIDAGAPGETAVLRRETSQYYRKLQATAQQTARREDIVLTTELVEGDEVQAIVECVRGTQSDLLVPGIPRHFSLVSRLWNHTTHDLSQQLASSILGSLSSVLLE